MKPIKPISLEDFANVSPEHAKVIREGAITADKLAITAAMAHIPDGRINISAAKTGPTIGAVSGKIVSGAVSPGPGFTGALTTAQVETITNLLLEARKQLRDAAASRIYAASYASTSGRIADALRDMGVDPN